MRWNFAAVIYGLIPLAFCSGLFAFAADDDIVIGRDEVDENVAKPDFIVVVQNQNAKGVMFLNHNQMAGINIQRINIQIDEPAKDHLLNRAIFGLNNNAHQWRRSVNLELESVIAEIDRVCQLTVVQRQRLELAGRSDQKRFLDEIDAFKRKSAEGTVDEFASDLQLLRTKAQNGISASDSLFVRSLRFSLTEEQNVKLRACRHSKRRQAIELAMSALDKMADLTPSQRGALSKLVNEILPDAADVESSDIVNAERLIGHSERLVILYQLALLAEEKVKPQIDPGQWETLWPRLAVYRQFEALLIKKGLIVAQAKHEEEKEH